MKKFLCLIMVLILTFSLVSLTASANTLTVQNIEEVSISGNTLSVSVKFESSVSATGYCAVYSEDSILKNAVTRTINGTSVSYEITDYTYQSGDYVKTFAWNDNYAPVSEYVTKNISTGYSVEGIVIETSYSYPDYYENTDTVTILFTNPYYEQFPEDEICTLLTTVDNITDYLGCSVVAQLDSNNIVYDISLKENANTFKTIETDLIDNIEPDNIIYYETASSKKATEAAIDPYVYVNGIEFDLSDLNIVVNGFNSSYHLADDFFEIVDYTDEITLLDNDNDGAFEFIFSNIFSEFSLEFVIDEIQHDDNVWCFSSKDDEVEFEIHSDDEDSYYKIIRDGEISDVSAIKEGDIITLLDAYASIYTVYVSSARIEGVIDEVDDDIHYINDIGYKISPLSGIEEIRAGTEGTFYINAFDKIVHIELPPLDYEYFYITDTGIDEGDFNSDIYLVKGITSSGEEAVYTLRSKTVDIYTPDGNATDIAADDAYEFVVEYRGIVKIVLDSNDRIYTIAFPNSIDDFLANDRYEDDAEYKSAYYNITRNTYGIVDLSDYTIIFDINTTNSTVNVTTVGEAFTHDESYSFIAYGPEDDVAQVLVSYDVTAPVIRPDSPELQPDYAYLIDYAISEDAFGEPQYLVQLLDEDGDIKPYTIYPRHANVYTKDGSFTNLTPEDAYNLVSSYIGVAMFTRNLEGYITEFYLPGCEAFSENRAYENTQAVYSKENLSLGNIIIDRSTILFNINTAEEDLADALSAYKVYKGLEDGVSYSFISYSKEGEVADVILVCDVEISSYEVENVMVVTKVATIRTENKETIKITGIKGGEKVNVIVDPEEVPLVAVKVGNVILYTEDIDYVTDVQVLFTSTSTDEGELCEDLEDILTNEFTDEGVTIHYGKITEKKSKYIILDDEYQYYFADEVNVIVVDYTGANVSISAGSLSDVKASSAKLKKTAFVKTSYDAEDEITDVVVFVTTT